ncbi:hypothetical protein [Devosia sp. Leaf64]|jgi:hypothetical protein|uniref:hypothetical protein n=1 Tax=Devosia sp. Leaf64 TaxID=1736229 RepID=UPI000716185C|nr:hypothetical protein [Devosia sp. Leaf64]KQN72390.1 hypothetical protein ASE94_07710 [Devosia sp. Leaf64]
MAVKRTIPHFKVGDPGDDRFSIYADDYQGDETALTSNRLSFVLKTGTTLAQAEELKRLMHTLIESVTEQS